MAGVLWNILQRALAQGFEGKPEHPPEIIPVVPTRAALPDNVSTREGGQSRLTLSDDR